MTADGVLLQYGAVGVIAVLALVAVRVMFVRETKAHDEDRDRADRMEKELRELNQAVRDQYLTTIAGAVTAINNANQAVANALSAVRR